MEVMSSITSSLIGIYNSLVSFIPPWAQNFVNLFVLVLLIVIYSIFVWKFYTFISKKNVLDLNLKQYNKSENVFFEKLFAGILYFFEYLLISPFLIFLWFIVLTFFLIALIENIVDLNTILLVSAAIIAAIRMIAYLPGYGEKLSQDVAKIFPLMLLTSAILTPSFFNENFFSVFIGRLAELPSYFVHAFQYLLFILILEFLLRFFDFIFYLFGLEDEPEEE